MEHGAAKVDITPTKPFQLAGYGSRKGRLFEAISRPLYLKAFYFEQRDKKQAKRNAIIVSADLIWWGSDRILEMREKMKQWWRLNESCIIFNATHNHSGSQTSN